MPDDWNYSIRVLAAICKDGAAVRELEVCGYIVRSHKREKGMRMSVKEYELLKEKSMAAGLSINAWLLVQLENNRPTLHGEKETWGVIRFMDEAGREINIIAHDFNSSYAQRSSFDPRKKVVWQKMRYFVYQNHKNAENNSNIKQRKEL